ncbi:hypothetical protein MUA77_11010 [Mammaliicoccus sciuri]|uniref:hypothetical protein n=1 Tax=Mammaliicoccus sciuri TaxID=1296 RepID=UPI0021D11E4E|nr:hypothetical protein [Mammaliicoccus sciuri]UXU83330.1 hypothetical protein MUA77_11010 [Mammaliicoccus sciuri]UXU93178.1 hypothetical protein MUA42_11020 [Mammaliicoccus sciuri]UXV15127.1 hypothetical protein MUA89_11285 [Mammaliicoccus sciuri]UXV23390.1 hypothetical protein MUA49_11015 [Mammaliicoccus sciuri]UXV26169.1 hypothetical protein MUA96_11270 [Mammaliicoccus sciuri]
MDKDLFDKKFDELKEFLEVELSVESDYFKQSQEKFREFNPELSEEKIFYLSLYELNKKYSQTITYNTAMLLLKDDEQSH